MIGWEDESSYRRTKRNVVFIITVLIFLAGFFTGWSTNKSPNCPTEDSCSVDYSNGEWHIKEVKP